jgi:Protein of unknown function (DUF2635)
MTDNTTRIKPAPGKVIVHPITRMRVPAEGETVPESAYWLRRIADGDVIVGTPPAPSSRKAASKQKPNTAAPAADDSRSDP